jgi:hypothetical protein
MPVAGLGLKQPPPIIFLLAQINPIYQFGARTLTKIFVFEISYLVKF